MNNLNNNNTIIENVEYLDMLDPKNSWYFDAERFDVNFPLVCSYRGDEKAGLFLHGWFTYWNHVFSYYRRRSDVIVFLIQRGGSSPLLEDFLAGAEILEEACWTAQENLEEPEFLFYLKDLGIKDRVDHRFLVGFRNNSFDEARFEIFKNSPVRKMNFPFDPFIPYEQLITTKDWNLVHRYFNWVFRNHQYRGSKFLYYGKRGLELPNIESFKDVGAIMESPISDLPKDFKNNSYEFLTRGANQGLLASDIFSYQSLET